MNSGFAGGLAQGLRNGAGLYNIYQDGMERKREREIERQLREAMADQGLDSARQQAAAPAPSNPRASAPGLSDAQPGAVTVRDTPILNTDGREQAGIPLTIEIEDQRLGRNGVGLGMASPGVTQVRDTPVLNTDGQEQSVPALTMEIEDQRLGRTPGLDTPGLSAVGSNANITEAGSAALSQMQPAAGVGAAPQQPQGRQGGQENQARGRQAQIPGDLERMTSSLTRGYRRALELGEPRKALELYVQREQLTSQYRDQAYAQAMDRFEITRDPNAFVQYVNMFDPSGGSFELQRIEERQEQAGGQPMYVVHGVDLETGEQFSRPFSQQALMSYINAAGDAQAYRGRFMQQAQHLYNMAEKQNEADLKVDTYSRMQDTAHRNRLEQIQAQGAEARRTRGYAAGLSRSGGRGGGSGGQAPADVRTAEWLIEQGVAADPSAAWEMVRGARTKPREQYVLETARMLMANQDPMAIGENRITPDKAIQQAQQLYDSIGGSNTESAPQASSDFDADAFIENQLRGAQDTEGSSEFDPNAFLNNF